jgi:hypothetical protein
MGSCVRAALVAWMLAGVLCLAVQTTTTTARALAPHVVHRVLQSSAEAGELEALFRTGLGRAHVAEFEMPRVMYRLEAYLLH